MPAAERMRKLLCVCGKPVVWLSLGGIEFDCARCSRKVLIPYEHLRGPEQVMRFLDDWRRSAQSRPSTRGDVRKSGH